MPQVWLPPADKQEVTTSHASQPARKPDPSNRYVARQPILTRDEQVFGYELLFRDGVENCFRGVDLNAAARTTVDNSMLIGFDVLCGGRRAFINCTREVLLKDYITLLPSGLTVVEVLEDVEPDDLIIAACQRLKAAGYQIALDDFVCGDPREPLTDLADIIKVDMRLTTSGQRADMVQRYGPWRSRLLAEKVETREEFIEVRNMGFVYFQGYFFQKPEILTTRGIPENRFNYVRMLQAVSKPELDEREIEDVIKSEASLCYRLLRYLNSAVFGLSNEIHSVRHALSMLGERETRRWIRLVATLGAGQGKSTELVTSALVRARFCELLSPRVQHGESDLFLMGLLSLMDAILELPMQEILTKLPLDQETKAVLRGGASRLRPLYQLMLARESGEWQSSAELSRLLHLSESEVAEAYWQAVQWAKQVGGA